MARPAATRLAAPPRPAGTRRAVDPLSTGALLVEESRLFYVAITRARQRLILTAVQAPEADGDQPSRFLAELDIPLKLVAGRPRRPLSLHGLVADLRRGALVHPRPRRR